MSRPGKKLTALGMVAALGICSYMTYAMVKGDRFLLPAQTSAGHYQIEEKCTLCHEKSFKGANIAELDKACVKCHGGTLVDEEDSHPSRIFNDPRNAAQLRMLNARSCTACHREHKPALTRSAGVTVPPNNCDACHNDVASERPTHRGLASNSCENAGCHNYHDNTALYEDFLRKHIGEPDTLPGGRVPVRGIGATPVARHPAPGDPGSGYGACKECHSREVASFSKSREGMRLAHDLGPMTPGQARLPMKAAAMSLKLNCTSCHGAGAFIANDAAVEKCLSCHDDRHSRAYKASIHYTLWLDEQAGRKPAGSGVSCATCHMPRTQEETRGSFRVFADHNVNGNQRPNEKMIRSVCMNCHGLKFSMDALADNVLVQENFRGRPSVHVATLAMVESRMRARMAHLNGKQTSDDNMGVAK